ncbi:MAG: DUF6519 domain-containing protein [Actinomycetota bacterium]|nr:DUF6519 domain-containing protein [Actinomycetota bacterium]
MTGDFTSVPLRSTDRWNAVRLQQGRVLLDTDWNLNVDGPARDERELALDVIGPAGVPAGSAAFEISFLGGHLTIGAGTMWIGGMLARNPTTLSYAVQAEIPPLPEAGLAVIYLDAFTEEVQAAEDPELLDPALDGVDTTTRMRVGWRVRAHETKSHSCSTVGLPAAGSTGQLDVVRTSAPVSPDPCAPPDDPRGRLPDGLLRIEVLDRGSETTARFAWSYADGGDAVAAKVAGTAVTLAPSPSVTFAPGDLVEVSTLARRADRRDHGPLFTVATVTPQAAGDLVALGSPSPLAGDPPGTCLRRWDGEVVGAPGAVTAALAGRDVGIAFTAHPGTYEVGDWWGVRVRGSAADAVETQTAAPPDGVLHTFTPLAVVDLGRRRVVADCRRTFPPLTSIRGNTCTVTAFPGDDLQAALNHLPSTGGELCLAAGHYPLRAPLQIHGKQRLVVVGVGPSTVLQVTGHESVLSATLCDDVEIAHLRAEAGHPKKPASPPGERHLLGALSFSGCHGVRVRDCEISIPDSTGRAQSGIHVDPAGDVLPDAVEIAGNRLEIGDQQVGVLVVSAGHVSVTANTIGLLPLLVGREPVLTRMVAAQLARYVAGHVLDADVKGGTAVALPGEQSFNVTGSTQVRRLAREFASQVTPAALRKAGTARAALDRFIAGAVLGRPTVGLTKASEAFFVNAVRSARCVGQGIVVAGERAVRVRIEGNSVSGVLQGIHVGLAGAGADAETAEQVVIRDNTVENLVPFFWARQRHAIYVGSSASTTLVDNHAHLTRGAVLRLGEIRPTPVEAVRIWGRLGPWLQIRGLDITGPYTVGVRIEDTSTTPPARAVRHVSDVLNLNGHRALLAPASVTSERCVP